MKPQSSPQADRKAGTPAIVAVLGWSGSGKTTFIRKAIEAAAAAGIPCAAAKRARHAADTGPGGKDSTVFLEAGAVGSAYISGHGTAIYLPQPSGNAASDYVGLLPPARIVFIEGEAPEGVREILVAGPEGADLKRPLEEIDILVSTDPVLRQKAQALGKRALDRDDAATLISWLLEDTRMHTDEPKPADADVRVYCDGVELPLVPFVAKLFSETIAAMTGTLKGGEDAKEITVTLRRL